MLTTRTRQCYDTTLIYLFIIGKEYLLPVALLSAIPDSTKATWRKYMREKFIGHSQQHILDTGIRQVELNQKYKHLSKVQSAVEAIYIGVSDMLELIKIPIYYLKANRELVLDLIAKHKDVLCLPTLLRIFKISRTTYQLWLLNIKVKCSASYFEQCTRRYGKQLLKPQVELIKEALTSDTYKYWPTSSIAYYFQRTNLLHVSVYTWYKYARLLGIKRKRKRRAKKYDSIPCTRPNEYWHVDITYVTTKDKIKHCVYFLSDNFSKKILAWRIANSVNWKYVKECIEDAYKVASKMEQPLNLNIVSDGGPENIHHNLKLYINSLIGNIKHVIALKDITFSNSPAETKNRTFKSYYSPEECENETQLRKLTTFYYEDINDIRPSGVLKGFTPTEVYTDTKPDYDFVNLRIQDAINRKQTNQNSTCNACEIIKHYKYDQNNKRKPLFSPN
jgi:putative transposase